MSVDRIFIFIIVNKKLTMNVKSKLNQIRLVLGLAAKFASATLKDGTTVEAEEFAPGNPLFIVAEDGTKKPAPEGEHQTDDGNIIEVDADGNIVGVENAAVEKTEIKPETEPVKAAADDAVPAPPTEAPVAMSEASVDNKIAEAMKKVAMAVEPLANDIAEIKSKVAKMEEQYAKFSKAPAAGKVPVINSDPSEKPQFDVLEARLAAIKEMRSIK